MVERVVRCQSHENWSTHCPWRVVIRRQVRMARTRMLLFSLISLSHSLTLPLSPPTSTLHLLCPVCIIHNQSYFTEPRDSHTMSATGFHVK